MDTSTLILALLPLALVQLGLVIYALYDLVRRPKVWGGNKIIWAAVILLVNFIGPVLYLTMGRGERE